MRRVDKIQGILFTRNEILNLSYMSRHKDSRTVVSHRLEGSISFIRMYVHSLYVTHYYACNDILMRH